MLLEFSVTNFRSIKEKQTLRHFSRIFGSPISCKIIGACWVFMYVALFSMRLEGAVSLELLIVSKNELENNFTAIPLSTGKTLDVLNSAVIYGANASGKSNLIKVLGAMLRIIENSFSYQANKGVKYIEPFLLAKDSVNQPTAFELDLIDGGVRYVYGFSATQEKIIDEWLYQYPKGSPQNLKGFFL
jgi:AAA15 family ATPase/GTPase